MTGHDALLDAGRLPPHPIARCIPRCLRMVDALVYSVHDQFKLILVADYARRSDLQAGAGPPYESDFSLVCATELGVVRGARHLGKPPTWRAYISV